MVPLGWGTGIQRAMSLFVIKPRVNALLFKSQHVFIHFINWFILPSVVSSSICSEVDTRNSR